ncbi:MAG: PVC-type heme-binding CxxCH protein [Chthoniobacter sp.]|uniref:PVC-type heme-binding CxxCH protein n=1 Tax=Chthoniobacter sp. TaxID=2510640 RepID=UPI0032A492B2
MKLPLLTLFALASSALAVDGNRLTYLDDDSPFWPTAQSPKFTTPQWIGEPGVDAVVILAIDDMRNAPNTPEGKPGTAKYETFLRPILDRLKKIDPAHGGDGRAPLSIMTNTVTPDDPQLAAWLREGVTIESHTLTHPCPCLGKATFEEAQRVYHDSVDLLSSIPGNQPVAFRMPCCDSMNSASPRFYSEIFNRTSPQGHWLSIDSSVFTLPPGERFRKYFPDAMRPPMKRSLGDYAGFIDDYPYPYVIGKLCWEFPCMVPSDWESFNVQSANSPVMLDDWKAALDHIVEKQGVFTAVFHPHGWSAPQQWVDFIDYAEKTYGKRVKFLNFREALERLEKNALGGRELRSPYGPDNGVRLLDVNADGFMDVVIGAANQPVTRVWQPTEQRWSESKTPANFVRFGDDGGISTGAEFGVLRDSAAPSLFVPGHPAAAWTYRDGGWQPDEALTHSFPDADQIRFRDFDHDGICELLTNRGIFLWSEKENRWQVADFTLPPDCALFDAQGRDNGLRFVDLNGDGFEDVIQSNDHGYAIYLWAGTVKARLGWSRGWPHLVSKGPATTDLAHAKILPFVKDGQNYGAWVHGDRLVWQNEALYSPESDTVQRTFKELIAFEMPPPKSPTDSLAAMQLPPGFTAELVASEPLIESPVAFDWDAQGRLWVVEMPDYPLGMDGKGQPGGKVKILTASQGDGHYDHATTFLEGLPFPNGIMPWRNGVIVSSSPNILFAAEADGHATEQRVLFTGFKEGNQQHRLNGFERGLDGWVYGANGDSGGTVNGVSISGRDYRFRPGSGEFEAESGSTQYGRHRDDWGNWFGNNNSTWLWHYTLEDHYLRRNPRLAVKTTKQPLANYPDATRVFPVSELAIRFNDTQALGHVTSGCSATPYRDDLFGPAFATSVFACEPVHNVIHREVLAPDGATFISRRANDEQDREFLASKDPWFRPVFLKTGPDGALYVADFYRFVLEHPEWIAPETLSRLDVRAGADKGRIYRIYPTGTKLRPIPNLAKLDNTALAAALDSTNGWQRDTAQRLLDERDAQDAVPAVKKLVTSAQSAKVRVQALATLDTLHAIDAETIRAALRDPRPEVRTQALRVSESLANQTTDVLPALISLLDDADFVVRHQLALSLGEFRDERATAALGTLAEREGENPQMRLAILSSLTPENPLFAKLNVANATAIPKIVLPKPSTPDRAKVIASYAGVAGLQGAPAHGHELYLQQCSICHRVKGEGHEVGPDLGMVGDKPIDWLLTAIFDPSAAVEARYQLHTLKLKNGTELAGIISAETANNLVLRLPGGTDLPVLRADLTSDQATTRSLMPEGLETVLKPQDVADVISYLRAK